MKTICSADGTELALDVHGSDAPVVVIDPELVDYFQRIAALTFVFSGGKSPESMKHAAKVTAAQIPNAQLGIVPGQTHTLSARAIALVLLAHLSDRRETAA